MNIFVASYLFLLGAVLGSFYAVVANRLPKEESLISPKSHCEYCSHQLKWYELIPILSYLLQWGKCRKCHHPLSLMYLFTELSTGLLFLISYLKFGITPTFFISCILSSLVILIFISDMKYMIILDSPLIISGILILIIQWINDGFSMMVSSVLGGLFMFLTLFLIGKLGALAFHKEALGGGDIKLSFVIGSTLGFQLGIVSFILATFLALPYAIVCLFLKEGHEVPFGPFLVSSLWIVFFFLDKFELLINYFFFI